MAASREAAHVAAGKSAVVPAASESPAVMSAAAEASAVPSPMPAASVTSATMAAAVGQCGARHSETDQRDRGKSRS